MRGVRRIALDFDGVIADTGVIKARWIETELAIRIDPGRSDRTSLLKRLSVAEYRRMQINIGESDLFATPPVAGSVNAIQELAKRFAIVVVSARSGTRLTSAERWLHIYKLFHFVEDVISAYTKPKVTLAESMGCSCLIDDDIRHLLVRPRTGIQRLLFCRADQRRVSGVDAVSSWPEIVWRLRSKSS